MSPRSAPQALLELLRPFVFFHLGSDASLRVEPCPQGVEIFVRHQRISPFSLRLTPQELEKLTSDPALLEEKMLGYLAEHRRSRS